MTRACSDCGKPISPASKGRCRACCARALANNRIARAKATATHRERNLNDPAYIKRLRARVSASIRSRQRTDPAYAEKRRDQGRRLYESGACVPHLKAGSPARMKAGRGVSERRIGWCPPQYRDEYRALLRKYKMTAAKAKAFMLAERITAFDRQMHAISQGRGIVAAFKAPEKDYGVTLGGGSPL